MGEANVLLFYFLVILDDEWWSIMEYDGHGYEIEADFARLVHQQVGKHADPMVRRHRGSPGAGWAAEVRQRANPSWLTTGGDSST
jgi:hypothetical protein